MRVAPTHPASQFDDEHALRLLIESVTDYAIFMLDLKGNVLTWNRGAERIKCYCAEEIIGMHFSLFYPEEEVESGKPQRVLEFALTHGKYEEEGWRLRKDRSRFWASVSITPVRDERGSLQGFAKITRDMTSRREMEERLHDANRQLEAFAYSISHDLRAPLRSMIFNSRLAMEDLAAEMTPDVKSLLECQLCNATRLARIVNELLEFSRMAKGEMAYEEVDLSVMAHEVRADLLEKDTRSRLAIEIEGGMIVRGNKPMLRSVIVNLLENAIKFSPKGGTIFFGRDRSEERETFVVRDRGIGFDMQYAHKLFLPFERLVADSQFEGTGIGLANVKKAIQRHGGEVWAESVEGQGSAFFFTLGSD